MSDEMCLALKDFIPWSHSEDGFVAGGNEIWLRGQDFIDGTSGDESSDEILPSVEDFILFSHS